MVQPKQLHTSLANRRCAFTAACRVPNCIKLTHTHASHSLTSENKTVETSEINETLFIKAQVGSNLACEKKSQIQPISKKRHFLTHFPKMRHISVIWFDGISMIACRDAHDLARAPDQVIPKSR
jgi:hypothetical protein